jgi:hypothetical protein
MHKNKEWKANSKPTDIDVITVITSLWFDRGTVCNAVGVYILYYYFVAS